MLRSLRIEKELNAFRLSNELNFVNSIILNFRSSFANIWFPQRANMGSDSVHNYEQLAITAHSQLNKSTYHTKFKSKSMYIDFCRSRQWIHIIWYEIFDHVGLFWESQNIHHYKAIYFSDMHDYVVAFRVWLLWIYFNGWRCSASIKAAVVLFESSSQLQLRGVILQNIRVVAIILYNIAF